MSDELDYDRDDGDLDREEEAAPAVLNTPGPSLQDRAKAAQAEREEASAPGRFNDWREQAAKELLKQFWTDISGRRLAARWTVSANSYYSVLLDAAGLSGKNGNPISVETLSVQIFLWLAIHPRDEWFLSREDIGLALKDYPDLWLERILDWAEVEFPLGPDHFERLRKASRLREKIMELSFTTRAVPAGELGPEESEPGN